MHIEVFKSELHWYLSYNLKCIKMRYISGWIDGRTDNKADILKRWLQNIGDMFMGGHWKILLSLQHACNFS